MRGSLRSAWLLSSSRMLQRKCLSRRQVCLEVLSMNNKERDREVFLRHCIALKFISKFIRMLVGRSERRRLNLENHTFEQ